MRVMMALLLGLYLVVPARAADGEPVLLLPGLSGPTAEAAPVRAGVPPGRGGRIKARKVRQKPANFALIIIDDSIFCGGLQRFFARAAKKNGEKWRV